jgi:hypothetical protein
VTRSLARRVQVLCLALAALLLVAGCGEDKSKTFAKDFRPINARIVALGRDVGAAVTGASGKSDHQIEATFTALGKRATALRKQVDDLDPPGKWENDRNDLSEAMNDASKALNAIGAAAAKGDPQAARRATIQLVAASDDLRSSRQRLARASGISR